ncbi:DMT family transporter [Nisaea acidiphila]|uniref:DMT family transporter n=1 Tax=Nisaea acidiphila TaxID=1862145 RepID=A0A9J7AY35_9PROT|nr:DMT family transporter [Nisaea acidiphila]UUX51345.1 DMT family transporter [Nisaea acidiphila]
MHIILFALSALIWGTGAYVTTLQAGPVPVPVSVAYRMLLLAGFMLVVLLATRSRLRVAGQDVPWIAAHAATFFALNFICFYYSTHLIPSGVATLALSTSPIFATVISFILFRETISLRALAGMVIGMAGLAVIVSPDLAKLSAGSDVLRGMLWALGAALGTAIGTIIGARNQRRGISPYTANFWGGIGGASICLAIALASGMEITIEPTALYLGSLVYLGIVASAGAFLIFFALVARVGPGRAAYTFTTVPVVALAMSVLLENVTLGPLMIAGTAMILTGNVLVLKR